MSDTSASRSSPATWEAVAALGAVLTGAVALGLLPLLAPVPLALGVWVRRRRSSERVVRIAATTGAVLGSLGAILLVVQTVAAFVRA